jgi:hypothetical protein
MQFIRNPLGWPMNASRLARCARVMSGNADSSGQSKGIMNKLYKSVPLLVAAAGFALAVSAGGVAYDEVTSYACG